MRDLIPVINSLSLSEETVSLIIVNAGSGNGLVPEDGKPFTEPALMYHQYEHMEHMWVDFL